MIGVLHPDGERTLLFDTNVQNNLENSLCWLGWDSGKRGWYTLFTPTQMDLFINKKSYILPMCYV